jgi:Family of unknown function (DUF5985)
MMYSFLSGALMMACLSAGFFFFKFWKKSKDQLFILFAFSFWLLALERFVLGYLATKFEPRPEIYLIRLCAFLIILYAIINKNRESRAE